MEWLCVLSAGSSGRRLGSENTPPRRGEGPSRWEQGERPHHRSRQEHRRYCRTHHQMHIRGSIAAVACNMNTGSRSASRDRHLILQLSIERPPEKAKREGSRGFLNYSSLIPDKQTIKYQAAPQLQTTEEGRGDLRIPVRGRLDPSPTAAQSRGRPQHRDIGDCV